MTYTDVSILDVDHRDILDCRFVLGTARNIFTVSLPSTFLWWLTEKKFLSQLDLNLFWNFIF